MRDLFSFLGVIKNASLSASWNSMAVSPSFNPGIVLN